MELDLTSLDTARRELIGQTWVWRMEQEHLAVPTFARFAIELADLGCQPATLELCTKAIADEARHVAAFREIARAIVGDGVPLVRGVPPIGEPWPNCSRTEQLAIDITEVCCIGETLKAMYLARIFETACEPIREVVKWLLTDEIDHGRLGWVYLAELHTSGVSLARVGEALSSLVERQLGHAFESTDSEEPALQPFGYLGPAAAMAIYRDGLAKMVLPGFDALGVDTAPVRLLCTERGWI